MIKHLVPKVILLSSLGLISVSCAPRPELAPYSNLINQGLLPVSTNNPYLGANLFLAAEAQRSGYLLNFLKGRGGPVAIALESTSFGGTSLLMYYPKDREVFQAELQPVQRGELLFGEWLVRGPYAIERRDYRELGRLDGSLIGEPVFMIRGKQTRFGPQTAPVAADKSSTIEQHSSEPVLIPVVPTPKPKKRPVITKHSSEHEAPAPTKAPELERPLNSDQQALRLAQGLLEKNDAGDGVHIVVSEKQTLKALAEWYTGDAHNGAEIAKASGIEQGKEPALASRVIIPKHLLKTDKRLLDH